MISFIIQTLFWLKFGPIWVSKGILENKTNATSHLNICSLMTAFKEE